MRNLTQQQLGKRVGVTTMCVSLWERGERVPSAVMLAKLSEALSARPDILLGYNVVVR